MAKYTHTMKLEQIKLHLDVLDSRTKQLKALIRKRKKNYNTTELNRILSKVRSAKKHVADAGFI